jgi:hypothetical protein
MFHIKYNLENYHISLKIVCKHIKSMYNVLENH